MKRWLVAVASDAALAVFFILWQGLGLEGAGNALLVALWIITLLKFLACLAPKELAKHVRSRPKGLTTYHVVSRITWAVAVAWVGHYVLAALMTIGWLMSEAVGAPDRREAKESP